MTSDVREVLSALIDREPVDPDVLARALEDPANRALLVDFVRMRAAVTEEEPEDERDSAHRPWLTPRVGVEQGYSPAQGRTAYPARPWLRAAAVFLLLSAGASGGAWWEHYASREHPPEPDRVVKLMPIDGEGR